MNESAYRADAVRPMMLAHTGMPRDRDERIPATHPLARGDR